MFYEVAKRDHGLPHDPFKALVAPRPIGWISTASAKGEINLSPYSFFNAVSDQPPMVAFCLAGQEGRAHLHRGNGRVRLQPRHVRAARRRERDFGAAGTRRKRDDPRRADAGAVAPRQAAARRRGAGGARMPASADGAADAAIGRRGALFPGDRRGSRNPHRRAFHRRMASSTRPRCGRSRGPVIAITSWRRPTRASP